MSNGERLETPADAGYRVQRRRLRWLILTAIIAFSGFVYWMYFVQVPKEYALDSDHFLHGSIGSDNAAGIPMSIWKVLPDTFPEYLPDQGRDYLKLKAAKAAAGQIVDHRDGYANFGFLIREGYDLPVGFSQRRYRIDLVGLNWRGLPHWNLGCRKQSPSRCRLQTCVTNRVHWITRCARFRAFADLWHARALDGPGGLLYISLPVRRRSAIQ